MPCSYISHKKGTFYVYKLSGFGCYYYGFTSNPNSRYFSHRKTIVVLLQQGRRTSPPSVTKRLHIHHYIAKCMYEKNIKWRHVLSYVDFEIVYKSKRKEWAVKKERALISESLHDNNCQNKRPW